jgi:hypothetical protein
MAASNAGKPKPLILKGNADSPLRQEGKVPGVHTTNDQYHPLQLGSLYLIKL